MRPLRNWSCALLLSLLTLSQAGQALADPLADANAIQRLVADWAAAWQAGRFDEYATYYAEGFSGSEAGHKAWRARRRARIEGRSDIRIELGPILVELHQDDPDLARAVFLQSYRSESWCDVVEKTLFLKRTGSGWRIGDERAVTRSRC